MTQEQFVEALFAWENLDLTELQAAYLAHVSAYYGKFMKIVVKQVKQNRSAVAALVKEFASFAFFFN
jgi:hypothetical protein